MTAYKALNTKEDDEESFKNLENFPNNDDDGDLTHDDEEDDDEYHDSIYKEDRYFFSFKEFKNAILYKNKKFSIFSCLLKFFLFLSILLSVFVIMLIIFPRKVTKTFIPNNLLSTDFENNVLKFNKYSEDLVYGKLELDDFGLIEDEIENTTVLPKTTFWDRSRVIFVVGARETGHDKFEAAFQDVCSKGDVECIPLCVQSSGRWSIAMDFALHENLIEETILEMNKARERYESYGKKKPMVFLVNLYGSCSRRKLSMTLPITEHVLDAATSVDIRAHVRLAQESNVDMRLVVLVDRNVKRTADRWIESYQHSVYTKTSYHVLRLIQMTYERMWLHLKLLDRKFYRAFDMDEYDLISTPFEKTYSIDEWTGLPGLGDALKAHRNDEHKYSIYNKKNEYGVILKPLDENDKQYIPRVQIAFNSLIELIEKKKARKVVKSSKKSKDRPRIVFFAGLEGTGHHLFTSVLTQMTKKYPKLKPHCEIQATLYHGNTHRSLGELILSKQYVATRNHLFDILKQVGNDDKALGMTYIVNTMDRVAGCHEMCGEQSYPNYGGYYKSYQTPDLVLLAQAAEKANVQLEVVLLTRSADDVMISTTVHRSFGAKRELRNLEIGAIALRSQVELIDEKFIATCVNFRHDMQYIKNLEKSLNFDFKESFDNIYKTTATRGKRARKKKDKYKAMRQRRIHTFNATTHDLELACPSM